MTKQLTTGNYSAKKGEQIKAFCREEIERLCTKWFVQFQSVSIRFVEGSNRKAKHTAFVGHDVTHDKAGRMQKDTTRTRLVIDARALHGRPVHAIKRLLAHEFAHILQYTYIPASLLNEYRSQPFDESLAVTDYARKNCFEFWAEAFAVVELGGAYNRTPEEAERCLAGFWEAIGYNEAFPA